MEKAIVTINKDTYKRIRASKAKFSIKEEKALTWDEFFKLLLNRERKKEVVKSWLYTLGIFTAVTLILSPFTYLVPQMIPVIFIVGFIIALFSTYVLTPWSLRGVKPFKNTSSQFLKSLEELSRNAGLKKFPELMIIETYEINAMVYASISGSRVCVTKGLMDAYQSGKIDEEELKAILGHEIHHIKSLDCLKWSFVLSWISIFDAMGTLYMLIGQGITHIGVATTEETVEEGIIGLLIVLAGWALLISGFVTKIIAKVASILAFHLSRRQEYVADEFGGELISPEKMIKALRKIDTLNNELVAKKLVTLPYADRWQIQPRNPSWIDRLWNTHPPLEKREGRLRKIGEFL